MKINRLKIVAISAFFILAYACKNPQEIVDPVVESVPSAEIVVDMRAYGGSDPIGIDNVTITGNKMSLKVKYSGGCEKHEFKLIGHKLVTTSSPPQRSIKLFHNANNDSCRELVETTLVYEISAFAFDDNEIMLRLDGYDKPISYIPLR